MALRELLAHFAVSVDDSKLKGLDQKISSAKDGLVTFGKAIAGLAIVKGTSDFIKRQIELGSRINDTSQQLGIGADELQKFAYAGKLNGVEFESASASLKLFSKAVGGVGEMGDATAEVFRKLGVETKSADGKTRPITETILDVADGISKLDDPAQQVAVSMKLFGRSGNQLLPILKQGRKGVEQLFGEFDALGGGLSGDFVEAADEAGDQIDRFKFAFQGLKIQIAGAVLPVITRLFVGFTEATRRFGHFAKETNLVKDGLSVLGVTGALSVLRLAKPLGGLLGQALGLGKGFRAVTFNLLKFGAIGLLVAGVALLFEDLFTLINGGDSVIGEFLDKMYGVGAAKEFADQLRGAWASLTEAFKQALPALADLGKTLLSAFTAALPYIIQGFIWVTKVIGANIELLSGFIRTIGAIPAAVKSGDFSKIGNIVDTAGDKALGFFRGNTLQQQLFGSAAPAAMIGPPPPPTLTAPGVAAGQVSQDNKITINVQGGANPQETGRAVAGGVKDGLSQQLRAAQAALATGG